MNILFHFRATLEELVATILALLAYALLALALMVLW